jgi:hypothetical protein
MAGRGNLYKIKAGLQFGKRIFVDAAVGFAQDCFTGHIENLDFPLIGIEYGNLFR